MLDTGYLMLDKKMHSLFQPESIDQNPVSCDIL